MQTMTHPHAKRAMHRARDYAQTPMNVYWEMTQACALACRHCRAEAMPKPHPLQLTYEESVSFLYQIAAFGDPERKAQPPCGGSRPGICAGSRSPSRNKTGRRAARFVAASRGGDHSKPCWKITSL